VIADLWVAALAALRSAVAGVMAVIELPVLIYFLAINTCYLLLIGFAAWDLVHHRRRAQHSGHDETVASQLAPGVSVIVPAYNEEAGIVTSVQAMLALRYPRHEVVVIDDGSTDGTVDRLRSAFDLVSVERELPTDVPTRAAVVDVLVPRNGRTRLVLVRKENSGRSDAVNVGINAAAEPLVAMVDADSILDPDSLLGVAKPFADDPIRTVATGGAIRAANGCRVVNGRIVQVRMPGSRLARIQVVEYLRAFMLGRTGWSRFGALVLISGAFGMFRRDILVEVGGLDVDSIGEDFELVMRIHRHLMDQRRDYHVEFVAEPISWTEVPVTAGVLRSQRRRWHRGLWETLWKYRRMLGNPRYGRVGMVALPCYWAFELFAPLLELAGLVLVVLGLALGVVDTSYAYVFLAVAYGYAILVTLAAMTVEELSFHKYDRWGDLRLMLAALVWENVGYRQLTAWWRLEGWWSGLTGRKQVWGTMTRQGFAGQDQDGAGQLSAGAARGGEKARG
jgi:cellulose synthase/poly-beta-1,6-N-acetylglucosamine synthase-like glycosyltransferase